MRDQTASTAASGNILSGQEKGDRYARLSLADRKDIVEILRATKKGLPDYFQPVAR